VAVFAPKIEGYMESYLQIDILGNHVVLLFQSYIYLIVSGESTPICQAACIHVYLYVLYMCALELLLLIRNVYMHVLIVSTGARLLVRALN
jgi:hypothetical protein